MTADRNGRLAVAAQTLSSLEELEAFAAGLLTPDELRVLRAYNDYTEWLGKETETPAAGQLTTREKMFLAWYRQQPDTDKATFRDTIAFLNRVGEVWKTRGAS